jgi:hypothetical protein
VSLWGRWSGGGIVTLLGCSAIANTSAANPLAGNLAQMVMPILIYSPIAAVLGGVLAALDYECERQEPHCAGAHGLGDDTGRPACRRSSMSRPSS